MAARDVNIVEKPRQVFWQSMVGRPIGTVVLVATCFLAAACSGSSAQEAALDVPADAADVADAADTADTSEIDDSPDETAATSPAGPDEEVTAGSANDDGSSADSDRGSRTLGADDDREPADTEAQDPPPTLEPVETNEPAPTPVATTAPLAPVEPEPTLAPTVTPVPTAAPVAAQPTTTPPPINSSQLPRGPVPSDDIVIEGPMVDESESAAISDSGAAACASAESAIEFLDFGDTNRMAAALQEAAQFASRATEPEISALAPQLAAAGPNEDAGVAVIIATLGACAIHGYQV